MWWYSQNEERWNGPCSDRDEAVSMGRDEYSGESFMVMEAETGEYDMRMSGDDILERLNERNEDRSDPDGDPAFDRIAPKAEKDLGDMVTSAIARWVRKHRIDTTAFCFKKQGKPETIPEDDTEYAEPPLLNNQ